MLVLNTDKLLRKELFYHVVFWSSGVH